MNVRTISIVFSNFLIVISCITTEKEDCHDNAYKENTKTICYGPIMGLITSSSTEKRGFTLNDFMSYCYITDKTHKCKNTSNNPTITFE